MAKHLSNRPRPPGEFVLYISELTKRGGKLFCLKRMWAASAVNSPLLYFRKHDSWRTIGLSADVCVSVCVSEWRTSAALTCTGDDHVNTYCIFKGQVVLSVVGTELPLLLWNEKTEIIIISSFTTIIDSYQGISVMESFTQSTSDYRYIMGEKPYVTCDM